MEGEIMAVTKVHHLNCASITGISVLGQHLVCHVLLLETNSSGLVLVDTGLGTADYAAPTSRLGAGFVRVYARPAIQPALAAVRQIEQLGYAASDVRHIVQTHLDLDHVGGLSDFPQATVHVHDTELRMALARKGLKARGRYRPAMWAHHPNWQPYTHGGSEWFGFEAARSLPGLDEDILTIPLFGHTHGHVGVAVRQGQRWILDAGDAYFDAREVKLAERVCGPGPQLFQWIVTTEFRARRENQDRLRALHREHPEIALFAAHNPFEYLDLVEQAGQPVRGTATARSWVPANRPVGAAR